jgi:hypothetical protein
MMPLQYLPMLDERLVQVLDVDVPVGFVVFHVAHFGAYKTVLEIRIRIFLGLQDPDPIVRGTDPDPSLF